MAQAASCGRTCRCKDCESLRERAAAANGFRLFQLYTEQEAATLLRFTYPTLKRKQRRRLIEHVERGDGSIMYLGWFIATTLIFGVRQINVPATVTNGPTFRLRSDRASSLVLARLGFKRPAKRARKGKAAARQPRAQEAAERRSGL